MRSEIKKTNKEIEEKEAQLVTQNKSKMRLMNG